MPMPMELQKELATYEARRSELLDRAGEYVLIRGDEILGFYHSYEDAIAGGYEKVGLKPFLVKKIEPVEAALFSTRDFPRCHT